MKICVSSYSFSKLMKAGSINQLQTIEKAKELGFDGIEFSDIIPHDGSDKLGYAKKLKAECDRLSMPAVDFVFAADFIGGMNGDTKAEIARVKEMVDIAEVLGVKTLRHDLISSLGHFRSFDLALPHISDAAREITVYAQEKGIKTMVENHGFICQDALRVERLFNAVNHENFGLLCDMGNFLCADEDPAKSVAIVAPYTFFAHAKDFHVKTDVNADPGEGFFRSRNGSFLRGAVIGHGDVPIKQCLEILKKSGYDGYISIEFEGIEEPLYGIKIGLDNLRRYVKEVYGE